MNDELDATRSAAGSRVLVMLDASRHSLVALGVAAELASVRQAELIALYIEDLDLVRSTGFPFAREVGASSGLFRVLSPAVLEGALLGQLARVQQSLDAVMKGRAVVHSLKVSRGRIVSEALRVIARDDLLVVGKAGGAASRGYYLGPTCWSLLLQAPCIVMMCEADNPLRPGTLWVWGEAVEPPPWVAETGLFDAVRVLPESIAVSALRSLLGHRQGALLIERSRLQALPDDARTLLSRLSMPVIVVPG